MTFEAIHVLIVFIAPLCIPFRILGGGKYVQLLKVKIFFCQTPESDLRVGGPGLLKWDIRPFIIHKRASLPKCALKQVSTSLDFLCIFSWFNQLLFIA